MEIKEVFKKYKSVIGVLHIEDGKIKLDTDDTKIDIKSVAICLNQFVTQYLQETEE